MIDYEVERYIVRKEQTLLEAMQIINRNHQGIGFVCEDYKLLGALSDGDIRRKLIKSGDLFSSVNSAANYNACYVYGEEKEKAEKLLYETDLTAIPLVDGGNHIVAIAVKEVLKSTVEKLISLPVVIMAGGRGTRLKPYTSVLPKPLIPIGDKTIVERIIEQFKDAGCSKFILIVNYKKELLKSYFNELCHDYNIIFLEEEQFLGTAGGLKLLENKINETFLVSNCDILVDCDYYKLLEQHKKNKNIVTVVCVKKKVTIPYGVFEIDESETRIREVQEKPSYDVVINTGLYIIEPEILKYIPSNTFIDFTDIIKNIIAEKKNVGTYIVSENKWLDMGETSELQKMKNKLLL